jgi:hypothetical protein
MLMVGFHIQFSKDALDEGRYCSDRLYLLAPAWLQPLAPLVHA